MQLHVKMYDQDNALNSHPMHCNFQDFSAYIHDCNGDVPLIVEILWHAYKSNPEVCFLLAVVIIQQGYQSAP